MSNCTAVKILRNNNDQISKKFFMKKNINENITKNEPWFKWLTRELNSYDAFNDFACGQDPEEVAEDFISSNMNAIEEFLDNFDEEDKDTLDQFLKLTECEWHVFRILEKQIAFRNKIRFVDFKKRKKQKFNLYKLKCEDFICTG